MDDLNWNWLQPVLNDFKTCCDSLNLFQIVDSPTRPNIKCPEKSSLIDLILTNAPTSTQLPPYLQTTSATTVLMEQSERQKFQKLNLTL